MKMYNAVTKNTPIVLFFNDLLTKQAASPHIDETLRLTAIISL